MSLTLAAYPRDPSSVQTAIHHICISICMLTSHTHATLNKLPICMETCATLSCSLMYTLCVHTRTRRLPQPSRCAYGLFFWAITFEAPRAQCSWTVLYSTVKSPVFPCLAFSSLNTGRQPPPPPNLPCSLPFHLIPLIPSPHGVCFSFSRMQLSTIPLPSIHLWRLNYRLSRFSCSQPLLQRGCRIVEDGWTDCACRGKEGWKYSWAESF